MKYAIIIKNSNTIISCLSVYFGNNKSIQSQTTRYAWVGNKLLAFSITLLMLITLNMGSLFSQGGTH